MGDEALPVSELTFAVQRKVPRFKFIAEAEVTSVRNGMRVVARVSELSVQGCYVDTPEAFPWEAPSACASTTAGAPVNSEAELSTPMPAGAWARSSKRWGRRRLRCSMRGSPNWPARPLAAPNVNLHYANRTSSEVAAFQSASTGLAVPAFPLSFAPLLFH